MSERHDDRWRSPTTYPLATTFPQLPSHSPQRAVEGGPGIRHQPWGEPDVHPDPVRFTELAVLKLKRQLAERWFVYILRCADGSFYTGVTNDLERRIQQHNAGTASRYTRSRLPVVRVYQEPQLTQSMALKRELAIKALPRTGKEALVASVKEGQ